MTAQRHRYSGENRGRSNGMVPVARGGSIAVRKARTTPEHRQWVVDLRAARPELSYADISRKFARTFNFVVGANWVGHVVRNARETGA